MIPITRRLAALLLLAAGWISAQRVVMVSFDGLGYQTFTKDPVAAELTVLRDTSRRGVTAEGMQAAFPSTTANSHAALWTGCYGDANHITANAPPVLPRAGHTSLERGNGFRATQLASETIWVTAAKAGLPAVAHQPTQGFPFTPMNSAPGAVVVNGYQTEMLAPHALWTQAGGAKQADGSWVFRHGPAAFRVERLKSGLRITEQSSRASVTVRAEPLEAEPPRRRALARRFSAGLHVAGPKPAVLYFRLFSLTAGDFRLYVTPWHELGMSVPAPEIFQAAGGFIGNGPHALLAGGKISEEEYLEAMELVIRQLTRHAAWLDRRFHPRFLQSYLPFPDEIDHEWLPAARAGSAAHQRWRRWGYIAVDRGAAEFAKLAGKSDYLLWVSDHGMAPVDKSVAVGKVLKDAGLDGSASYLYNSILVNTADWKGGSVPLENRAAVVEQARRALSAVPAITEFFTPEQHGAQYGIGGPAGGDLYFDLAPGYAASPRTTGALIETFKPRGVHGFLPAREDMQAICILAGPGVAPASRWPRIRSVDVAPLIADLLGIAPAAGTQGVSPRRARAGR